MLYKEWIDFVLYSSNSVVKTRQERLDIKNAIPEIESYTNPELAKKNGVIINWNDYAFKDDVFEAAWIGDIGSVIIWTKKRVWTLYQRTGSKEKIIYLPRNPDLSELFG